MPTSSDNKLKSYSHFCPYRSAAAKAQAKFTRRQNVERYRRLLKTATDEKRRNYLGLIIEEQQKQKDAGIQNTNIEDDPVVAGLALGGIERNQLKNFSMVLNFRDLVEVKLQAASFI